MPTKAKNLKDIFRIDLNELRRQREEQRAKEGKPPTKLGPSELYIFL